ncbi:SSI family serine proteinase inhibitor [Streptomyces sp. HUAS 31]|uniref:SSI family serine proteinase inhibitor n=1 Tax=Streptomyces sp. HUAS 31 TaxID=3020055 RepID=UPI002306ABA9|nr:SSI family serine proteinase inhibitor [Streptomyces sp. HUAS 31]WCD98000.1 SSI family serine proteinase inhibitor [Streptomyces sp. HUAS 31]
MLQVNRSARAGHLRRVLLTATGALAAVGLTSVAPVAAAPAAVPSAKDPDRAGDHLTVTVRDAGDGADGTHELTCHPAGGDHPRAADACAALDSGTRWGKDAFAPVPQGTFCTMQYGGSATAHVTGTWAGRPVDARYDRSDGCEIARWNRLVPLLPDVRAQGRRL